MEWKGEERIGWIGDFGMGLDCCKVGDITFSRSKDSFYPSSIFLSPCFSFH